MSKAVPKKMSEFEKKGDEVYQRLRRQLESQHKGKVIAIEPESGEYFLGADVLGVLQKAKKRFPQKIFHILRVGYPAVWRVPFSR